MSLQQGLDRTTLQAALSAVLDRVLPEAGGVPYRLVGTAASLLYGVDAPARDVDILFQRRDDLDAWAAALQAYPCLHTPAWLPDAHQYFGRYGIGGSVLELSTVEVPSSSDVLETLGPGPWRHFRTLECGIHQVPTVALELRLITELYRNRTDHFRPILRFMQVHGCDREFLRRALGEARIGADLSSEVLAHLASAPFLQIQG